MRLAERVCEDAGIHFYDVIFDWRGATECVRCDMVILEGHLVTRTLRHIHVARRTGVRRCWHTLL